ncbi:non-ribosomal peptide synthetase [Algoriphagus sp.]|uniref:non-ribosomal peptide synthetase n=1 Tax=Algoriphagus sp. TaxID=1872435 RepID=UPI002603EFA4|nr:non-ribosomal peptide synthetase [Algoriphagus sp.]
MLYNSTSRQIKGLFELFEAQVLLNPNNLALIFEGYELTYSTLNKLSNQLAHYLRTQGIGQETVVGICMQRSPELILSILAIWKAGGAYLPLDPDYPKDRLQYMVEDSGISSILSHRASQTASVQLFQKFGKKVLVWESLQKEIANYPTENLALPIEDSDLSYIIYTSGSTGKPKGVMIEHRNVVHLAYALQQFIVLKPGERVLQFASISFDASVLELILALTSGSALVMASKENLMPGHQLTATINCHKVNITLLSPTALNQLNPDQLPSLHTVLSGGEALPLSTAKQWANTKSLINAYGPTEITVCATLSRVEKDSKQITLGKALPNYRVYILDQEGNQLPSGSPGELCIGGAGVGRGYLNRPELTLEKFVADPFTPEGKMYRSGDLAQWLPNGEIEFLGRIDHQVKIRGFRIELGEIENALLSKSDITQAAVTVREDIQGGKYLCAYYVSAVQKTVEELRTYLGQTLADFMIPARFVPMEKLPLSPSGKIDRKALPEPGEIITTGAEFVAPSTELEIRITRLYAQLLNLVSDSISINDSFLALGGDSLKSAQLAGRLWQQTGTCVSVKDIFTNPTVSGLATLIRSRGKSETKKITKAPLLESYPLASAQKRVYLHSLQQGSDSVLYNLPAVYEVGGTLDHRQLTKAFQQVINCSDAFRTSFQMDGEILRQQVLDQVIVDIPLLTFPEAEIEETIKNWGSKPFDLSHPPLIRLELWQAGGSQFLLIDTHHVIMDGMSHKLFFQALSDAYVGKELSAHPFSFMDYVHWQQSENQQLERIEQSGFWKSMYSGGMPRLEFPVDFHALTIPDSKGETYFFKLEGELFDQVKKHGGEIGITPFIFLYAAFTLLISKYVQSENVVIATTSSGRNLPETEDIIGMFVNTLAIQNKLNPDLPFSSFLENTKQLLLSAFENDAFPYDELIADLRAKGLEVNSVQVMFTLLQAGYQHQTIGGHPINLLRVKHETTPMFDLTLSGFEDKETIGFEFEYKCKFFNPESIKLLADRFLNVLRIAVNVPQKTVSTIPLILEVEEKTLSIWSNPSQEIPKNQNVLHFFESKVLEFPHQTALSFGNLELTFSQLNQQANQLAHYLISSGIKKESIVGVFMQRSSELIISILAIGKAGAAYLPLDPEYPSDRLEFMVEDASSHILLTHLPCKAQVEEKLSNYSGDQVFWENIQDELMKRPIQNPNLSISGSDLAYIIYTSGSTGKPKGVLLEHGGLVNLILAQTERFSLTPDSKVLQFASISFDTSLWEILLSLCAGASLVMVKPENLLLGQHLTDTIRKYKVTHFTAPPSVLAVLNPLDFPDLEVVVSGGESLKKETAAFWARHKKLFNAYGPTEATIEVLVSEVSPDPDQVTIGKPLPNTRVHILDPHGNQVPIGLRGELYIGGVGVARGYLNRPELTAEKFVADPFSPGQRLYRTGDLARWLPSGEVEFLGRIDQQVKIRGFRIELGEIEDNLLAYPGILDVAVTVRQSSDGSDLLCAYYVSNVERSVVELRDFLSRTLPAYMIPARYMQLPEFPLTPNGKVDRKALPEPGETILSGAEFIAPSTPEENIIARLWAQLLGLALESISTLDDFFALGGDSLKSAQLAGRLSQETGTSVSVKDIFSNPSLASLASLISSKGQSTFFKITKAPLLDSYPLASAQKRVYLHSLQQGFDAVLYNMPAVYEVDGALDHGLLTQAFQQVVNRYDAFRTSFLIDGEDLRQRVLEGVRVDIPVQVLLEEEIEGALKSWGTQPFDLGNAPLIRMQLWQTERQQFLLIDTHHLIMDGMSYEPFFRSLCDAYQGKSLSADALSFLDYAYWQQSGAQRQVQAEQAEFWQSMFENGIPALELPLDFHGTAIPNPHGATHSFKLEGELFRNIKKQCKESGTTPFIFLYAAFTLLISKYAQTKEIVIGTTSSGRNLPETQDMIGMFVNTLAIRNQVEGSLPFTTFLDRTKQLLLSAFENDAYPYEELVADLRSKGHTDQAVRVMFTLLKESEDTLHLGDSRLLLKETESVSQAKFDLSLSGVEREEEINFDLVYAEALFSGESMRLLAERFLNVLDQAVQVPQEPIERCSILLDQEAEQIQSWNSKVLEVPQTALIHELFEAMVLEYPEHIALIFGQQQLSYSVLNQQANRLAHYLRSCGIAAERRVGICLERSSELIISILAVWKSGGAYVPLDPSYPGDRLAYMIEDSGLELILTQNSLLPLLELVCQTSQVQLVSNEELETGLAGYPQTNPDPACHSDNLAYVIYTSGTTGKPKGVMLEHRNAVNLAFAQQHSIWVNPSDRVLQFASSSFDASVFELLLALASGAGLVMASKEELLPGPSLTRIINTHQVSLAVLTPVVLSHLEPAQLPSLHRVFSAGEALPLTTAQKWASATTLINAYGPTEITVCATLSKVDPKAERITIGNPLPNYQCHILDPEGNQLPIGVAGELYIGGAGVARGYLNRPELAAEKFVTDPFNPARRIYRSGDLARWLPSGEVEFLGRIDQQVKIRGFRIELGEIEDNLLEYPGILEVALTVRQDHQGEKYLCAYYVSETEKTVEELRGFLGQTLPEFMIPARYVAMENLPLSPAGKIDRKALPEPGQTVNTGSKFIAPESELELLIAGLYSKLLGIDQETIGTGDSFFALGGDSLKSAQLAGRLSQETLTVVSVKDVFTNPTVRGLAALISSKAPSTSIKISKAPVLDSYPLASAQKRVYLHSLQQGSDAVLYNMPIVYQVKEGKLEAGLLGKALQTIVNQSSTLRTSIVMRDGELTQVIAPKVSMTVSEKRFSESDLMGQVKNWGKTPFNLVEVPLIRVELWKTASRQLLAIDTHHIIFDGMSYKPFFEALSNAYQGIEPTTMPLDFFDYAFWQQSAAFQELKLNDAKFWHEMFSDGIQPLELPLDFSAPLVRNHSGGTMSFQLEGELLESIYLHCKQTGTTPFIFLYAACTLLISKYAQSEDVVIATTSSGRNLPETENMIGMFVNTLAIRNQIEGNDSFSSFLAKTKEILLTAFENDSYPYDELVVSLRSMGLSDHEVQVMFTMIKDVELQQTIDDCSLEIFGGSESSQAMFDLTFSGRETQECIAFDIEYASEFFSKSSIERLIKRFLQLLHLILNRPNELVSKHSILLQEEEEQLENWNQKNGKTEQAKSTEALFLQKVEEYPNKDALLFEDERISFLELNTKSNELGDWMRIQGVIPGSHVGLCMSRSIELVVGILAIWKVGAVYIPLDPDYPQERLQFMVDDAAIQFLLSHKSSQHTLANALDSFNGKILIWEDFVKNEHSSFTQNPNLSISGSDLAYIIYTSGSTGKPKGVLLEHGGLVNLILAQTERFSLTPDSKVLQFASISFDTSLWEILLSLCAGASLVMVKPENLLLGQHLTDTIRKYKVTHFTAPPSVLAVLNPLDFPDLEVVVSGGESLKKETAAFWARHKKLFNAYGPTEATIEVLVSEVSPDPDQVTIGKPLPNTRVHILDPHGNQVPIGLRGELYIGGVGVARGYLNRPELTAEKFVADPFSPGQRLYRTGDLARWLPSGEVEFLGRIDQQVKIRGFRIELGEIEDNLLAYPGILDVAVTVRQSSDGSDLLCAYYVSNVERSVVELRDFLSRTLPAYMIPARYMQLPEFPLTPNGKVDRKALPEPGETILSGAEFIAPSTPEENIIARLWAQLLGLALESISTLDDFFALGGDSLKSAQLAGRLSQETGTSVSVKDIFSNPSLASLASLISSKGQSTFFKITKAPLLDSYPLASAQKRVYLHSLQQGFDAVLYNMPAVYEVDGALDHGLLTQAFQQVVNRYDAFRTSFLIDGEDLRQRVLEGVRVDIPVQVLLEEEIEGALKSWGTQPFDLGNAPLIRMQLWQTERQQFLLIDTHHLIMDGMSYEPFFRSLCDAYQGKSLSADALSFLDYAYWQQSGAQRQVQAEQAEFWQSMFENGIPALELPLDFHGTAIPNPHGATHSFKLEGELFRNIKKQCKESGTTPFIFLYAAFTLLISKYAQTKEIVIGTTSSGRNLPETQDMIGMFVNTLAIRNQVEGSLPFTTFLDRTKQLLLSAFENDAYPYEELVADLRSKGHTDQAVRVMFTLLKESEDTLHLGDSRLLLKETESVSQAKFDLSLSGVEREEEINFDLVYAEALFSGESMRLLAERFLNVLDQAVQVPQEPIERCSILLDQEAEQIQSWNSKVLEVPQTALIHELFEAMVLEYPEHIALIFGQQQLSYSVLNQQANRLAHYLRSCGIAAERRVGICLERSSELIISILAVWKSGGAYVPLDPSYPGDRLAYMIEDSGLELILTQNSLLPLLELVCQTSQVQLVSNEELETGLAGYPQTNPDPACHSDNLAYVIYTSGTTGKPKGVMLEHRNAVNLAFAQQHSIWVNPSDRVLQFASSSFDASVFELLLALASGAGLVMASKEELLPGPSLTRIINTHQVSLAVLTPVVLSHLEPAQLPSLHRVFSAGEALPLTTAQKWASATTLINAYGPTEITVCATLSKVDPKAERITIGNPLPNYQCHILDPEGNQLPIGVAGELYIGGAGVARGYLNRPELAAEKFVTDPFNPARRIYRSGDLARWLPSGEVEFLGRIDQQVKIRGFRIELGEIEDNLLEYPGILEVALTVRQDHQGEKYLCAYYVSETEKTVEELRGFLGQTLPEFMIPARYVAMENLPLSPAGKIDRKALPEPGESILTGTEFIAPRTKQEKDIVELWSKTLGLRIEEIGIEDDFFALGGNSLKAVSLIAEIQKHLLKKLPLHEVFKRTTVRAQSDFLNDLKTDKSQTESSLIPLQPKGIKTPLFIAPGIEGKCYYLVELAKALGEDQPVYGFQSVGLLAGEEPLTSIEAMAEFNIQLMKKIQPSGPYLLGGHSMGGWVVMEMSNQLRKQGEKVVFLGLFDSYSPTIFEQREGFSIHSNDQEINDLLLLLQRLADYYDPEINLSELKKILDLVAQSDRTEKVNQWAISKGLVPANFSQEEIKRWAQVIGINSRMSFQPKSTKQKTILFKAEETESETSEVPRCLGWSSVMTTTLQIAVTPGNHISMMIEPNVTYLAKAIQANLAGFGNYQEEFSTLKNSNSASKKKQLEI